MTKTTYDTKVREVARFKNAWGDEYIVINQTAWYDAKKHTEAEAIKAYKEKRGIK